MEYSLHVLWIIRRGDFHVFERNSIASKTAYGSASTPRVCWGPKGAPASRPKHLSRLYLNQSISQTPSRNSHLWIKHLSEQLQQNFTSKSSTSAVWHPIRSGLKTKSRGKKAKSRGLWGKYVSGQEAAREATFCPHKKYPPASASEYGAPPNF